MAETEEPLVELLKNLAGAAVVLAALLCAAGWSSLHAYYASFGVDLGDLDIPLYHALIYSLPVIFHSLWSGLGILGGIILLGIVLSAKRVRNHIMTAWGTAISFVLVLIAGEETMQQMQGGKVHDN